MSLDGRWLKNVSDHFSYAMLDAACSWASLTTIDLFAQVNRCHVFACPTWLQARATIWQLNDFVRWKQTKNRRIIKLKGALILVFSTVARCLLVISVTNIIQSFLGSEWSVCGRTELSDVFFEDVRGLYLGLIQLAGALRIELAWKRWLQRPGEIWVNADQSGWVMQLHPWGTPWKRV